MKVIVSGSRLIVDKEFVFAVLDNSPFKIDTLIHGDAKGVDRLSGMWADENGVVCIPYPAKWNLFGKRAGPLRNEAMLELGNALISIWDGKSKGAAHMINIALIAGLPTLVVNTNNKEILLKNFE